MAELLKPASFSHEVELTESKVSASDLELIPFPDLTSDSDLSAAACTFFLQLFTSKASQYMRAHMCNTPDQVLAWMQGISQNEARQDHFVLYKGQVVGFVTLTDLGDRTAETQTVLDIGYHRKGIGRWARTQLIKLAQQQGVSKLVSVVDERNLPSTNLTLSLGFRPTGERRIDDSIRPGEPNYQVPTRRVYERRLGEKG